MQESATVVERSAQEPPGVGDAIASITILGGHGKSGEPEAIRRVQLQMGDVISIVGPTGSGKTTLINDLELFADGATPTGRRILIDDATPPPTTATIRRTTRSR